MLENKKRTAEEILDELAQKFADLFIEEILWEREKDGGRKKRRKVDKGP